MRWEFLIRIEAIVTNYLTQFSNALDTMFFDHRLPPPKAKQNKFWHSFYFVVWFFPYVLEHSSVFKGKKLETYKKLILIQLKYNKITIQGHFLPMLKRFYGFQNTNVLKYLMNGFSPQVKQRIRKFFHEMIQISNNGTSLVIFW